MLDAKAFRQLPILGVAKPLQLACGPIRHIVGALHHGHGGNTSGLALRPRKRRCRSPVAARPHDLNAQVVVLNVLRQPSNHRYCFLQPLDLARRLRECGQRLDE
jgi:hypothetical protein